MKIAYFDCFSGAAGDMILASLVAAGVDPGDLRAELAKLGLPGYALHIEPVRKQGFASTQVTVELTDKGGTTEHRHLQTIKDIIDASTLSVSVRNTAKSIFSKLAQAEAKVHGTTVEAVHFHEVGAVDAIVDIVGAAIGVELLGLDRVVCSPIPTGSGTVKCEHGIMPVPAPATAELLVGVPLANCEEVGELTTPTGAAILTTLAESFGPLPAMRIERCGFGAGRRDGLKRPNVLRLIVGESSEERFEASDEADRVVVLEANLDDATGEQVGYACELLFKAGALDVYTTGVQMKKNRPGILLTVVAGAGEAEACEAVLFAETTTFGVRRHECMRSKLQRSSTLVSTRFGDVHMKTGRRGDRVVTASPEYEDCARIAREQGVALREVMSESLRVWHNENGTGK